MSFNIELNTKEIITEIFINILKMLHRRCKIDNIENTFSSISNIIHNKTNIQFKLNDDNLCSVYLVNIKLNSIAQGSPLDDYLSNNLNIHKIIIFKDPSKKVLKQIFYDYSNVEFFFEHEMLEDIPSKIFIPEHILLNQDEKDELLTKFNENDLSIILDIDVMARYYNAKVYDIFKIIRPSICSGKSIFYRRVMPGILDIYF